MEAPINNTVSDQSSNESSEDIFPDVLLFATYLKMFLLLLATPTITVPASMIMHVIWKNERLHTKYYFLVTNLLVTDITTTGRYVYEIFSMILYLFGVTIYPSNKMMALFYTVISVAILSHTIAANECNRYGFDVSSPGLSCADKAI